ncbi:anti-anti-sigma factor [Thermomonospora umbrina]|uniref:Anti-sigma factor antagonist n=2 Tax=Thermomonospora umbrina TaxID=111806 RepID=A0A3D9SJ28_9ACTN|nr:anti-anti-sigma factor [Thermomonospora umbrina]
MHVTTAEPPRGENGEDRVVVRAVGELDLATAPLLRGHLARVLLTHRRPRVVLDLADLTFCDSSGLSVLIEAHKRLRAAAGGLILSGVTGQPALLLERTGLNRLFVLTDGTDAGDTGTVGTDAGRRAGAVMASARARVPNPSGSPPSGLTWSGVPGSHHVRTPAAGTSRRSGR